MSTKWKLKGCPRCKGDVFLEKDHFGWYQQCLQCGYLKDLDVVYKSGVKEIERPTKWDWHGKRRKAKKKAIA